ncbi:MAG: glucosaminidase domain-containing protein [Sphingobacteriales bacterium]|nr:glucosaminidase domain-containing protein [Sphingobacteriales bacterium]
MKRYLLFLSLVLVLSACSSKKKAMRKANQKVEKVAERKANGEFVTFTAESYINRFKGIAIEEMNKYGVPASITLAQALLESGTGNSDLARYANNHFGIKCTNGWQGKGYYKDDDQKNECFRVYKNPDESFRDHSKFLLRSRYADLFNLDKDDYKSWAKGLKADGYATNPRYPELLISIIEKYNLDQFDEKDKRSSRRMKENDVSNDNTKLSSPAVNAKNKYIVQQGDTLYNLSKRFGLTVEELKSLNGLTDHVIKIGQELIIKK